MVNLYGLITEDEADTMYLAGKATGRVRGEGGIAQPGVRRFVARGVTNMARCHPEKKAWGWGLCNNCYTRQQLKHNPEARAAKARVRRQHNLKAMYELTTAQYESMLELQGGVCAICAEPPTPRRWTNARLAVDHDHDTGLVRGLLCDGCNLALGRLGPHLESAARYLEKAIHDRNRES